MACVLDTIYQIMVLKAFYPGEVLVVAVVCAVVPYFLVRGPLMRTCALLNPKWAGNSRIRMPHQRRSSMADSLDKYHNKSRWPVPFAGLRGLDAARTSRARFRRA